MADQMRHKACNPCRERKVKCDGVQPMCVRCARSGVQCSYAPPPAKRQSKADVTATLDMLNHRLFQAEVALATHLQTEELPSSTQLTQTPALAWEQLPVVPSNGMAGSEMTTGNVLSVPADLFQVPPTSLVDPPWSQNAITVPTVSDTTDEHPWLYESDNHTSSGSVILPGYISPLPPWSTWSTIEGVGYPEPENNAPFTASQLHGKRRRCDAEVEETNADQVTTSDVNRQNSQPTIELRSLPPETVCANRQERRKIGHGSAFNNITKLEGSENYLEWTRGIRAAARKEGVWDIIMGQCPRPKDPGPHASIMECRAFQDDMIYWNNKNDLALGGLEGCLEPTAQLIVDDVNDAHLLWLKLEERYKPDGKI